MTRFVFPAQDIRRWGEDGLLQGYMARHVQPASLDAIVASDKVHVLPGVIKPLPGQPVQELLDTYGTHKFSIEDQPLLPRFHYLVQLTPGFKPAPTNIEVSPKSSIGRLDLHVRTLVDGYPGFDVVPANYSGPMYAIISPNSFPVRLSPGTPLTQLRFMQPQSGPVLTRSQVYRDNVVQPSNKLHLYLADGFVGYKAKQVCRPVDLDCYDHKVDDFWERIVVDNGRYLLKRGEFGIFMTHDKVSIDPKEAGVLHPLSVEGGDLRIHYAGFIDPGFGYSHPNNIVLEIRPYEDVYLQHGEAICHMRVDKLRDVPLVDGKPFNYDTHGTNYQQQTTPRLSKFFKE